MKRAIKIEIEAKSELRDTISRYNEVVNYCLKVGFEHKTHNKIRIHHLTYKKARELFPELRSNLICAARDQASETLKSSLKGLPVKKNDSAIRYNERTINVNLKNQTLTLSTVKGRIKIEFNLPEYFLKYSEWKSKAANLGFKKKQLYLHLIVETNTPEKQEIKKVIGIDRGIVNPAVTSDNKFFNSKKIRLIKSRNQFLRSRLQVKGTRSAKRHLKKISGREKRFVTCINHCLAKKIVNSDAQVFALEKLGIRLKKKNGKKKNRILGNWCYYQFQKFLEYKAEELGKSIIQVNPQYTSQRCSKCNFTDKTNRKENSFDCKECGFKLNADLNAARNIAKLGITLLDRLTSSSQSLQILK